MTRKSTALEIELEKLKKRFDSFQDKTVEAAISLDKRLKVLEKDSTMQRQRKGDLDEVARQKRRHPK